MTEKSSLEKQASGTAIATAFMRALAAYDPRKEMRGNDYLAEIFLEGKQKKPLKDPAIRSWVMKNKNDDGYGKMGKRSFCGVVITRWRKYAFLPYERLYL